MGSVQFNPCSVLNPCGELTANPVRRGLCERAEVWPWIYQPKDRPPPWLST